MKENKTMDRKKVISLIKKGRNPFLMVQTDGKTVPVTLETDGDEIWFTRDTGVVKYSTGFSYRCFLNSTEHILLPEATTQKPEKESA